MLLSKAAWGRGRERRPVRLCVLLVHFSLFLPPPQPPLSWTGLSRKEMRSFFDGADETRLGAATSFPVNQEKKHVDNLHLKKKSKRVLQFQRHSMVWSFTRVPPQDFRLTWSILDFTMKYFVLFDAYYYILYRYWYFMIRADQYHNMGNFYVL